LGRHGKGSFLEKEIVIHCFKKCGTAVAIDGSEDSEIHIEGIDDYIIEDEEDKESTDEDPFAEIENEDPFGETENEDMPSDMDK